MFRLACAPVALTFQSARVSQELTVHCWRPSPHRNLSTFSRTSLTHKRINHCFDLVEVKRIIKSKWHRFSKQAWIAGMYTDDPSRI